MSTRPLAFNPKNLYFSEIDLHLDGHYPQPFAFISHAHADHVSRHEKIICSKPTAALLIKRFSIDPDKIQALDWDTPHKISDHTIRLYPAGHIAGSAMIHISNGSQSLLYTGDFKMRPSYTSEDPIFPQADILVMESTFGLPKYSFPPTEEIHKQLIEFTQSALADNCSPIILAYSLGKAQEAIAILTKAGIPLVQHRAVYEMTSTFRTLEIHPLPPPIKLEKSIPTSHALIAPPNVVRSRAIRSLKNKRTVMLSGWALNPSATYRYQTDAAIPLSDHADFPDLIKAVETVKPELVYTLHGSTREFAAELRKRGHQAWSVFGDDQLELISSVAPPNKKSKSLPRPQSELSTLTDTLEQLSEHSSRLKKIEILASYLAELPTTELKIVTNWIRETRTNRISPSIIKLSVQQASRSPLAKYKTISAQQNDSARTARLLLEDAKLKPQPYTLQKIHAAITEINQSSAQIEKVALLVKLLKSNHSREGETIIRISSGGIRAGVKDGIIEEALASAFNVQNSEIRRAHMLTGDLAETADLAKQNQLESAKLMPGTPLKPMLASPATDVAKILEWHTKLETDSPIWAEEKFDGIRAQLHVAETECHLFSRDLNLIDHQFPELITAASKLPPCILDGEVIAFQPDADAKKLTFQDIQKRLGRKAQNVHQGDLFGGPAIPVSFIAFDCVWSSSWQGPNLYEQPLTTRRKILEDLPLEFPISPIEVQKIDPTQPEVLEQAFKSAIKANNEGLILKDDRTPYQPGRRGRSWMKLKGVMPSLDCVVIAAQQGHGKRAGVLSDYTFAIRDDKTGDLLTLGKAYSGLTDEEIEELTVHFQRNTIGKPKRKIHEVRPNVILEIAFDRISPSKRHNSGLALRFPRIKGIRHDKTIDDIDTYSTALSIVKK